MRYLSGSQQNAAETVLAAADVNIRVILSHRKRLSGLLDSIETAREKVLTIGASVADIREAATFAQALANLASATKGLIASEREAFGLADGAGAPAGERPKRVTLEFVDVAP